MAESLDVHLSLVQFHSMNLSVAREVTLELVDAARVLQADQFTVHGVAVLNELGLLNFREQAGV